MPYPTISEDKRLELLTPTTGRARVVLDTDTYNEVDDQFALAQAVLSPDQISLEAVTAAPFHNNRSNGPADGMEKSYEEILRLLELLKHDPEGLVYRGSTGYMDAADSPVESEAAKKIIELAMRNAGEPLHVVAIGAITNVSSAIVMEPGIIERIVVVWLGGNQQSYHTAKEFNLRQDPVASRIVFDCGVPLVHVPCHRIASHLITTIPELAHHLKDKTQLADYLYETVRDYGGGHAWSKVIWDLAAVSWLVNPEWAPTRLVPSPILTDELTWQLDSSRHTIREVTGVKRDAIFGDVFAKLTQ